MPHFFGMPPSTYVPPSLAGVEKVLGRDILFRNGNDYEVSAAGDWRTVDGDENLRLALLRRLLTTPGEYKPFPNYGAGLRAQVKANAGKASMDAMANLVREQVRLDPRVQEVLEVSVTKRPDGSGVIEVVVSVRSRGRDVTLGPLGFAEGQKGFGV